MANDKKRIPQARMLVHHLERLRDRGVFVDAELQTVQATIDLLQDAPLRPTPQVSMPTGPLVDAASHPGRCPTCGALTLLPKPK